LKTQWSPQARGDLREIYLRILPENPAAARSLQGRIRAAVQMLQTAPQIGRPGRVPGTRELVISDTPYIVPYRMVGRTLQILRVYHGARRWPDALP